jgi:hypothetical protein
MNAPRRSLLLALTLAAPLASRAQVPAVPDWALPGSATHHQVPPPADFHRPTRTKPFGGSVRVGPFEGQSEVGGPLVPSAARYDLMTHQYTLTAAGYNIWYSRDEFLYLWTKVSGDVSLAADVTFPNPGGYGDRKAVLIIRQSLDDDSKEAMVALHGAGLIHLAERPATGADIKEAYRQKSDPAGAVPKRIGIEKRGDAFFLYVSLAGEPMHQVGGPMDLHFDGPFYAGIGFCSHLPDKADTAVLGNVVFASAAGQVH